MRSVSWRIGIYWVNEEKKTVSSDFRFHGELKLQEINTDSVYIDAHEVPWCLYTQSHIVMCHLIHNRLYFNDFECLLLVLLLQFGIWDWGLNLHQLLKFCEMYCLTDWSPLMESEWRCIWKIDVLPKINVCAGIAVMAAKSNSVQICTCLTQRMKFADMQENK